MRNSFARALLQVLALLTGLAVASVWRDRHNTLSDYPEFVSTKANLGLGVNGAQSFLHTPVALANGALNLAAWHGHQEIELAKDWAHPPEISLRVRGDEASEVEIGLRSGDSRVYLRLSNRPSRPSAWLEAAPDGFFTKVTPLGYKLPKAKWARVKLLPENGRVAAEVEGVKLGTAIAAPGAPLRVLFRGDSTAGNLRVDDIHIADGGTIYEQHYSGEVPWALFLLTITVASLAFFAVELFTSPRTAAIVAGVGFLLLCSLLALYRGSLAYRYPLDVPLAGVPSRIETREAVLARLKALPTEGKPLILWLGGSQAWGAGASNVSHTASFLLGREWGGQYSPFDWVNGAISSARVRDQKEVFDLVRSRRHVTYVVLTAGVNDAENPLFPDQLTAFAHEVRAAGAHLILIPEPSEPEPATLIASRQADVVAVGKREGIPVIDIQPFFNKHDDDGFLWWDFVHLSDAGARLEHQALAPHLLVEIPLPAGNH